MAVSHRRRSPTIRNPHSQKHEAVASVSAISIFLACNFQNKRVKRHFDSLKRLWEETLPIKVYLSDKVQAAGARDIWVDISKTIREANLAIFDITSFRPNVVLELGYSLALKDYEKIVICRDLTPGGRRAPQSDKWELSDIGHLFRLDYKNFDKLDQNLLAHIERMSPVQGFYQLVREIERHPTWSAKKYVSVALDALKRLRDNGPLRRRETSRLLREGGIIEVKAVENLFKKLRLAMPSSGQSGVWKLID